MRERAHWADSAMTCSEEDARRDSNSVTRVCGAEPGVTEEFPSAMQALRTRPRHFVRLIELPRKSSRNSASLKLASHSSRGNRSDSLADDGDVLVPFDTSGGKTLG